MSILSTSWALADCVPAKSDARSTEEAEVIDCMDDEDDHLNKINYPCSKCNRSFLSQNAFFTHVCSKSDCNNGFLCPQCETSFSGLKDLKHHVKTCWNGMLSCVICSIIICGKVGMIKHLQEHKKRSPQPQTREKACLVCGLFDEKWNLMEHWRVHTGVNLLECVVCKKIMELNSVQQHLAAHRRDNPAWSELNWCHSCGLTFINKSVFSNHRNGHSTKRYSHLCEKCGLFFQSFDDLEQHILYHVDQNTIYKCTKCHKIYPLREHFDIHCKTCFKLGEMDLTKVSTQAFLRGIREKHLKVFNTHTLDLIRYALKKDTVKCVYSIKPPPGQIKEPQASSSSGIILMNQRKVDKNAVVLYSCQVCQRKFVAKESFTRHWREHTGFDPNKCVICSETFAMPKLLEIHMSVAHSSCFKCSSCSMVFRTCLEHKYHTIAHMRKNAHFCELCGAGFDEFNYLEYHVFLNHVKECQVKKCPPSGSSGPVVNCTTSTQETPANGTVGNASYVPQSSGSHSVTTANSSAPVGDTSYILQSSQSHATITANLPTVVAGGGTVNLPRPLISNSYVSNSGVITKQAIPITNSSPMIVNTLAKILPKPSATVSVIGQTRQVIQPPLRDLYMCTVCKAVAPDLPTMLQHTKTHKM